MKIKQWIDGSWEITWPTGRHHAGEMTADEMDQLVCEHNSRIGHLNAHRTVGAMRDATIEPKMLSDEMPKDVLEACVRIALFHLSDDTTFTPEQLRFMRKFVKGSDEDVELVAV